MLARLDTLVCVSVGDFGDWESVHTSLSPFHHLPGDKGNHFLKLWGINEAMSPHT